MITTKKYKSARWSIELPASWEVDNEDDCVTFADENGIGALQISAYRRYSEDVTYDDLINFAEDELVEGIELLNVQYGDFTGIGFSYLEKENYWRKWWLRSGSLILYVTYNCSTKEHNLEADVVNQMLNSLKIPYYATN